ncbi:MAG: sensor domain-containing diguanylate cyclase [Methylococcales bacterium]|nr:sensor domain-containing diguanylate cyclase [Methylococcales bacterium]MBT7409921.1 sensor domain-containing diguanylate cyclase [Methylococcales bacterium]
MRKSYEQQLGSLIWNARQNEEKLQKFQCYEMQLLEMNTLPDLVNQVVYESKSTFQLDVVTLMLLDPDYEFRRFLKTEGFILEDHPALMFSESPPGFNSVYSAKDLTKPNMGVFNAKIHGRYFPVKLYTPQSVAMLPLIRYGCLIGSLNFGSAKVRRFYSELGSDFLKHLGAVVGICFENTLNHERVRCMGLTDTLTGVNNRRFFDQRLDEEVKRVFRNNEPLTCLFLDIDFFKKINDTYGHQAGDIVLAEVADVISIQLRQNDVLARYGGEEFTALLSHTKIDVAVEVAERIRENVEKMVVTTDDGTEIRITISIGVGSLFPDNCDDHEKAGQLLIETADKAVYQAKETGRNKVVCIGCQSAKDS